MNSTVLYISKPFFRFSDLPGLSSFLNVPYLFVNISMVGVFFRWSSLCWSPRLTFHYSWSPFAYSQSNDCRYSTKAFVILSTRQSELHYLIIIFLRKKICTKTHLILRNRWKYLLHPSCRRISLVQNRPNLKPAQGGDLHRKADSILSNGPRQHTTTLYEIRRLLKSFSQIKH